MPLPFQNHIISYLILIQTGFTFLVPACPRRLEKRPLNVCVCVCVGACVAVGLNVEIIGAETATNVRGHHVIEQLVDPGLFQRQLVSSLFDHRLQIARVLLHHLQQVVHQVFAPTSFTAVATVVNN